MQLLVTGKGFCGDFEHFSSIVRKSSNRDLLYP